jgi:hypothetical protein
MGGTFSMYGIIRNAHILVGNHELERPLGTPRCRWEDNIKMDIKEIMYQLLKSATQC